MSARSNDVVLPLNAEAADNTCGSCHFFTRRGTSEFDAKSGVCRLRLPPQYAQLPYNAELEQPSNTVDDTDSCDLWRPSGKTFIVSKRVGP